MKSIHSLLADLTSGDDNLAEHAARALAALGEDVIPSLENLLESPDVDTRWWGLRTLAQLETPPLDWLIAALADVSTEVRQCALLGMCLHPDERAIPALVGLLQDPDAITADLVVNALIANAEPAVQPLLDMYESSSTPVKKSIVRALASIADSRAIPTLMNALDEDSLTMNFWAERGLERLGMGMVYLKPE
ncbi:MAG: HEAT repeat domain-containing protein [Chloroflexota bacterium]